MTKQQPNKVDEFLQMMAATATKLYRERLNDFNGRIAESGFTQAFKWYGVDVALYEQRMLLWQRAASALIGKPLSEQAAHVTGMRQEMTKQLIARLDVPAAGGSPLHNVSTLVEREAKGNFLDENGGLWSLIRLEYEIAAAMKEGHNSAETKRGIPPVLRDIAPPLRGCARFY